MCTKRYWALWKKNGSEASEQTEPYLEKSSIISQINYYRGRQPVIDEGMKISLEVRDLEEDTRKYGNWKVNNDTVYFSSVYCIVFTQS